MLMEVSIAERLPEPATLNFTSRVNSALDIIELGLRHSKRPILTTKFGPQSAVLLHLVSKVRPDIEVVWVDTGFNTQATKNHAETLTKELGLNLKTYRAVVPWEGDAPQAVDPELETFAEHVKLEPFRRALADLEPDAWVTGVRREQTEFREGLTAFQTGKNDTLKICPLIDWTDEDMANYLAFHRLPVAEDYNDPTKVEPHLECGLHNRL